MLSGTSANSAHAGGAFFATEWASQYSPAGATMNTADMARMEEQFRMQQQHPNDMTGAHA